MAWGGGSKIWGERASVARAGPRIGVEAKGDAPSQRAEKGAGAKAMTEKVTKRQGLGLATWNQVKGGKRGKRGKD